MAHKGIHSPCRRTSRRSCRSTVRYEVLPPQDKALVLLGCEHSRAVTAYCCDIPDLQIHEITYSNSYSCTQFKPCGNAAGLVHYIMIAAQSMIHLKGNFRSVIPISLNRILNSFQFLGKLSLPLHSTFISSAMIVSFQK